PFWRPNPKPTKPLAPRANRTRRRRRTRHPPETSPDNPLASAPTANPSSSPRGHFLLTRPRSRRPPRRTLWVRPGRPDEPRTREPEPPESQSFSLRLRVRDKLGSIFQSKDDP